MFSEHWLDHSSCLNHLNNARAPRAPRRQVELLSSLVSWPSPFQHSAFSASATVSCLFPAALSKGDTVNQCRLEGCLTEHPSPLTPRPSCHPSLWPELAQDVPEMPREGQQTYLPFPEYSTANAPVRGYQLLPLPIDSLPSPKTIFTMIQGFPGANRLLDKLSSGSMDILTTTSPKGRKER